MAIRYDGDFLVNTFGDDFVVVWEAIQKGYGLEKWHSPDMYEYKYGLWRAVGPDQTKEPVGVFDTPQEVVAILKLIFASTE